MSASSAPAVKAALLTLFQADATLSTVQVAYCDPAVARQRESVYFMSTHSTEELAANGSRKQIETYFLEVAVFVAKDTDDPQACEERCWALVGRVETVVRAQNGLPSGPISTALVGGGMITMAATEMRPYIGPPGARIAEAICQIRVQGYKAP